MRKTAEKSSAASLGTKRACPQCGTKFYDFNKEDLTCPKCDAKVDPNSNKTFKAPEPKKPKKEGPEAALSESEDIVVGGDEAFESVEDIEDEDEELVDDIDTEEEGRGDF